MGYIGDMSGSSSAPGANWITLRFRAREAGTFRLIPVNWHLVDKNTGEVQEASNTPETSFMVEETHEYEMTACRPQYRSEVFKVKKPFVVPYYDVQMKRETAPVGIIHGLRQFFGI